MLVDILCRSVIADKVFQTINVQSRHLGKRIDLLVAFPLLIIENIVVDGLVLDEMQVTALNIVQYALGGALVAL